MTYGRPSPPPDDLSVELRELERELSDLQIAERPSFGPELEAELERAWLAGPEEIARSGAGRRALAASVGALLFVGLTVPPVRAALVDFSLQSLSLFGVGQEPEQPSPAVAVSTPAPSPAAAVSEEVPAPVASIDGGDEDEGSVEGAVPEVPFLPPAVTFVDLLDREQSQEAIRRYYPRELQTAGIGGTVRLGAWVLPSGEATDITVNLTSGYVALDRAAMRAAQELRFRPSERAGQPVGSPVTFDMVFEPQPEIAALPTVVPLDRPKIPENLVSDLPGLFSAASVVPAPDPLGGEELLRVALGWGPRMERDLGSISHLLAGEVPPGMTPLRWRSRALEALEIAFRNDLDNPAPYLAAGRIRRRQGLSQSAMAFFLRGLEFAERGSRPISPALVADLNYERGLVLKDAWLARKDLGEISSYEVSDPSCQWMDDTGAADRLLNINYNCPRELRWVMEHAFTPVAKDEAPRETMLAAFEQAVEAWPGHAGANVELLLDLADHGAWYEMLTEARSFSWASRGHPYAYLLSGLALHRMGRTEEAEGDYILALRSLPDEEVGEIKDIRLLLSKEVASALSALDEEDTETAHETFWTSLDPILSTEVNERQIEHYARATYAYLRFGGVSTEPGEVWLRYGRPVEIRTLGEDSGLRTEFWDYGRGTPHVTFRRHSESVDMSLTPEAAAYLAELGQLVPHWYGTHARPVTGLEAQMARFRGGLPGTSEVEIHTEVPTELATGEADSLDLGVFLLRSDGSLVTNTRSKLPAVSSTVRLVAFADADVSRVALEFYHPGLQKAAIARSSVTRSAEEGEDLRVSDLLLVEPVPTVSGEITRRDESWIAALPSADDGAGDEIGMLFELYDLPEELEPHTIRVQMHAVGEARTFPVRFKSAGSSEFTEEVTRLGEPGEDRSIEYLILDLAGVPPGGYDIDLWVDLAGGYEPIRSTHRLDR